MLHKSPIESDPIFDPDALLKDIRFQDPGTARENFSQIQQHVSRQLIRALPAMLADAPDPDCAISFFERFISEAAPEISRLLEDHHHLAHYALLVFAYSRFLGETLIHDPDLLATIEQEKSLDQTFSRDDFAHRLERHRWRTSEKDASTLLAHFKRRQYVRILLRDVLKIASLGETTAEISALSDVLVEAALEQAQNEIQRRYGPPQHLDGAGRVQGTPFAVISLGKLGGNELNYSSDIDLMFIFGDGAEPAGSKISLREYFIRLAQELTNILCCATIQGAVFRIDLRLRPQGGEGELAINLAQALRYYASTAQDWEKQALIKARHSAGDAALARRFIAGVRPYVYTPEANFAAIKTALVAREKMQKRHTSDQAESIDVKIGSGGIRDIEFLVQCLQRVYGGAEPWLQSSSTLFSLHKLHDNRHLSGREFHELSSAYEFLRTLEHRLQLRRGQQIHRMPLSGPELQILQRSMAGFEIGEPNHNGFITAVRRRMATVAEIYQRVIFQQQTRRDLDATNAEFHLHAVPEFNVADHSNRQVLERLAADAPELYKLATQVDLSSTARKNLFRFFTAALTSSERYAAVLRNAAAVNRAIPLFEAGDFLTQVLTRHPEEIATLANPAQASSRAGSGYLFESPLTQGRAEDPAFEYLANSGASFNEKLALLRRHFRHRVFASGAKDILDHRDVYTSCAETTSAAEDAIAAAFEIADAPEGLAVMALGRLGAGELDLLSDADLLFVCDEQQDRQQLTQAVSRMVQVLSAYTREGMVLAVDTRLRPRGAEGELLTTPTHLARYFEQEAHAWEALTYTKLRFLAGSVGLGQQACAAAARLFQRFAVDPEFLPAIREMRQKVEVADSENNFKTSPGGIYDIDFLSGFLLVKNGVTNKNGSLRDRLWRCAGAGLLAKQDAAALDHAGELLRTVDHVVRLLTGRSWRWLAPTEHGRQLTEKLTSEILRCNFKDGLAAELYRTCRKVREIYARVVGVPG